MKKLFTLIFSLSVVVYLTAAASYAQSKGPVHVPSINSGPSANHGSSSKGNPAKLAADQQAAAKPDKTHPDWQARFEDRMQNNAAFRTKIESLLPAGTTFETAASGFKNQGRFIAALHVSQNLNIPFDQLKATMLGLDPKTMQPLPDSTPKSLGQAIHELRPDIAESQVQVEVKRAGKQTKETVGAPTNTTS